MSSTLGHGPQQPSTADGSPAPHRPPEPGRQASQDVDQAHAAGQPRAAGERDTVGRARGSFGRATTIAVLVVTAQVLLVALFAWPALKTAPRDLPVVVAAPPPAAAALTQQLQSARSGAFTVSTVADLAAADAALRDREAYAAFILGPDGPTLHVASAAAPAVAQLLTQQAQALGNGERIPVVDVVATDADDPRGAGFAAGFLPLVLTSMAAGVLVTVAVRSRRARLGGIALFAALAGLASAAVLQYWLDALPGAYLANAAVIALLALAVSTTVAGLGALLGGAGIALGVVLVFVLGNPLSAVASAPELLPQPWGQLGQLLPVGAGARLLRSTAYFDGAGGTAAAWTLAAWAAAGLAFLLAGRRQVAAH
jgi:hypothetical protein